MEEKQERYQSRTWYSNVILCVHIFLPFVLCLVQPRGRWRQEWPQVRNGGGWVSGDGKKGQPHLSLHTLIFYHLKVTLFLFIMYIFDIYFKLGCFLSHYMKGRS